MPMNSGRKCMTLPSGPRIPSVAAQQAGRCALVGRPWNSGHRSIFAGTYEDGTIRDGGCVPWQAPITGQTLKAEYENLGPGWDVAARREYNYSMLLDKET